MRKGSPHSSTCGSLVPRLSHTHVSSCMQTGQRRRQGYKLVLSARDEGYYQRRIVMTGLSTQGDPSGTGGQESAGETGQSQVVDLAAAGHSRMFRINHTFTPSYIPLRVIEKVKIYSCYFYFLYICPMQSYDWTDCGLYMNCVWLVEMWSF